MVAPNHLTALRMLLTPVGVAALLFPWPHAIAIALAVFIIAAATDALDGYIARKHRLQSDWGAFLDPLADKLLVLGYAIGLQYQEVIPAWIVALTVGREILVDAYRSYAYARGVVIPARWPGKVKTVMQSIAIPLGVIGAGGMTGEFAIGIQIVGWCISASAALFLMAFCIGLSVFDDLRRARPSSLIIDSRLSECRGDACGD